MMMAPKPRDPWWEQDPDRPSHASHTPDTDNAPPEPYAAERGTCPFCGSGEVTHLAIGMPASPFSGAGAPEWVAWVGCVHPGYTRSCTACGATWDPFVGPPGGDPL